MKSPEAKEMTKSTAEQAMTKSMVELETMW